MTYATWADRLALALEEMFLTFDRQTGYLSEQDLARIARNWADPATFDADAADLLSFLMHQTRPL